MDVTPETEAVRCLGFWATSNGNMKAAMDLVMERTLRAKETLCASIPHAPHTLPQTTCNTADVSKLLVVCHGTSSLRFGSDHFVSVFLRSPTPSGMWGVSMQGFLFSQAARPRRRDVLDLFGQGGRRGARAVAAVCSFSATCRRFPQPHIFRHSCHFPVQTFCGI